MNKWLRKITLLILTTLALPGTQTAIAQEMNIFKRISNYTPEDTARIMNTFRTGWLLKDNLPDSAIWYYNQALTRSRNTHFTDGIALMLFNMGLIELERDNYNETLTYLRQSLPYARQAKYFNNITAGVYINIGQVYFRTSDYKRAARYYDSALQVNLTSKSKNKNYALAFNYNGLSLIYIQLKQYEKALYYLALAEEICRKDSLWQTLAMIITNKMGVYVWQKAYDKAMLCYEEGMALTRKYKIPRDQAPAGLLCSASEIMLQQGKPEAALQYLAGIKDEPAGNNYYMEVRTGYLWGSAYLQLKEYAKAEHKLLQALQIAGQKNINDDRIKAHKMLSELYEETGAYDKALAQHQIYHQLYDSIFSKEKVKDINELEISYRTAEKDRKLAVMESNVLKEQARNQWQKTTIVITFLGILLLVRVLIFLR